MPEVVDYYTVRLAAEDSAGQSNEAYFSVLVDTVQPTVALHAPQGPMWAGLATIGGKYNKKQVEKIIVNPGNAAAVLGKQNRTFFAEVQLQEGENTLTASLTDWIGRTATASLSITCRATAASPEIQMQEIKETGSSKLILGESLLFDAGSAQLKPAAFQALDKIIDMLENFKDAKARVDGHTDNVPISAGAPFKANLELSQARAKTVFYYLIKKGTVASDRITVKGFGDAKPVASNTTEEGRAKNRRVEITIISPPK